MPIAAIEAGGMMKRGYLILVCLGAVGCNRAADVEVAAVGAPPPAVVLTSALGPLSLHDKLYLLERELAAGAARGKVDDEAIARYFRAEAITDRLLASDAPYRWLALGYDVEARIRQIQSLADRVVAQLRRGAPEAGIQEDVAELRRQVADLQGALAEPGGAAPPSLDALLASVRADSIRALVSEGAVGE
jgi:hypothetical protein